MATKKKLLQAAAGAAGGEALNVEDVFSTYLYEGNGSTQTITNGIDLDGEGGMVWIKTRDAANAHSLTDTERGRLKILKSNTTDAEVTANDSFHINSFNSNGFTLGQTWINGTNSTNNNNASWTFRKAPKFFDVVTYTGDGVAGKTVSHNLGSVPGCIIVKRLDAARDWIVFHRSLNVNGDNAPETDGIILQSSNPAFDSSSIWNDTAPTSTDFTLGSGLSVNASGSPHVAYLFAHNDGDGEFGPDGDLDAIKCGSYTGNGSSNGPEVDLGFEPQWVMIKRSSGIANWRMYDNMRGIVTGGNDSYLNANTSDAETSAERIELTPTGFKVVTTTADTNSSGSTYIYIAIRRGPMAVPESATEVFDVNEATNPRGFVTTGFPVDLHMQRKLESGDGFNLADRLRGENKFLYTTETSAEYTFGSTFPAEFDHMDGIDNYSYSSQVGKDTIFYNWRRAPNFFDVVAYTGTGSARTVSHNLGVAPEMMWIKKRDLGAQWVVYHQGLDATAPEDYFIRFDTSAREDNINRFNDTAPTSSVFTVNNNATVNTSGGEYIAYLFASLDGVSKVGSYTGNGSTTGPSIDCGFSAGPRFVLIKRTDSAENWYMFDSERGIVAGADPYLMLNSTSAEINAGDIIDPTSSGFQLATNGSSVNASGGTYIFYAIA